MTRILLFTVAALCAAHLPASAHTSLEITASTLNVRSGPGTGYSRIGSIPRGQVYVQVGTSGAWRKIWWSGGTAWIHGGYVRTSGLANASVTAATLNVRSGPGTGYGKVGTAPKGSYWAIAGSSGAWRKIYFAGAARWVHGSYLSSGSAPSTGSGGGFVNLPAAGPGYYAYSASYRRWGTSSTVYGLIRAAGSWKSEHGSYPRIGVGDISLKGGGYFSPHVTHREGKDVDIRPVASSGYEGGLTIYSGSYSSYRTKHWFVHHLVTHAPVYRILFNDKAIYGSLSYVVYYSGHHNHHHADFR